MVFDLNVPKVLFNHGLNVDGAAQRYIDSEVIKLSDPIVPFRDGPLKKSAGIHTQIGSGVVIYKTPYARYQYYRNLSHSNGRSMKWFEKMKAANKDAIKSGLQRFL